MFHNWALLQKRVGGGGGRNRFHHLSHKPPTPPPPQCASDNSLVASFSAALRPQRPYGLLGTIKPRTSTSTFTQLLSPGKARAVQKHLGVAAWWLTLWPNQISPCHSLLVSLDRLTGLVRGGNRVSTLLPAIAGPRRVWNWRAERGEEEGGGGGGGQAEERNS